MTGSAGTLSLDILMSLAERESGGYGLADPGLVERIGKILAWINERGPYTVEQTLAIQRQLQRLLVARLRIAMDRRAYPGIAEVKVEQPIFVIGFARSGTTLLNALLAEEPDVLSPLAWHTRSPSPPPGAMPVCAGRIAMAQRDVEHWTDICPGQLPLHPYADRGAFQLIEDEELFTLDFRNLYPSLSYRIPSLEVKVVLQEDLEGAMRFHKEIIQHLMWNTGKRHWSSKFATSQNHLALLFETYPDALCVWSHRPLSEIYASNVTIRAASYDAINGKPMDWSSQAREFAIRTKESVDRMMASAMIDDPRVLHLPFHKLSADPIGAIRDVCQKRGRPMSAAYEARLRSWLDDPENRIDRYGRYPYSYEPLGLDRAWIKDLFADYSKRFGLKDRE